MVVAAAAIALTAMPHDSFVPVGLIVIALVVIYGVVFVVRLRRIPKDDKP